MRIGDKRPSLMVLVLVAPAVVSQNATAQSLITLTPNSQGLVALAHDAAFSPPDTFQSDTQQPSSLPYSSTSNAADGTSFSQNLYNLKDADLSFVFSDGRPGFPNSFARSDGEVTFQANYDLHYILSGNYTATGALSEMEEDETLVDAQSNGTLFFGNNENNSSGTTGHLTVGGSQGQAASNGGHLQGTLFAGHAYDLSYGDVLFSTAADGGATASGSLDLSLSLRGDLNGDRSVGFDDLLTLVQHYGLPSQTYKTGDIDGDGRVTFEDLLILAQHYGESVSMAGVAPVPEPSILAGIASFVLVMRRRRT